MIEKNIDHILFTFMQIQLQGKRSDVTMAKRKNIFPCYMNFLFIIIIMFYVNYVVREVGKKVK